MSYSIGNNQDAQRPIRQQRLLLRQLLDKKKKAYNPI